MSAEEARLSREDELALLGIARETLEAYGSGRDRTPADPGRPALIERRGAFVTLKKQGQLRGCIGTFRPEGPLWRVVVNRTLDAASRDPRFNPVTADEIPLIRIEISALTPLRDAADPGEIRVGVHGIYISKGIFSGVLLPQVAEEHGWDRETFLDQTCRKAGLPPGAWRDPDIRLQVFSAQVFGEEAGPTRGPA